MSEVDLSVLARGYALRPASPAALARAAEAASLPSVGDPALDVGAGRGEHARAFAAAGLRPVALDPSPDMAHSAARSGVVCVIGRSQDLPFRDGAFGLVYFHLSLHYGDWRRALGEARRVLRPGGACVVWTLGERHHRASMLARWFPSIVRIDGARFPEADEVARRLEGLGMRVESERRPEVVEKTAGEWIAAVEAGFVSTLQLLPDGEVESGLRAFRKAHPDPNEVITYVLDYDHIAATAPAEDGSSPQSGSAGPPLA